MLSDRPILSRLPALFRRAASVNFCQSREVGGFSWGNTQRSWEVSQVNEMLTQMESHPLPSFAQRI